VSDYFSAKLTSVYGFLWDFISELFSITCHIVSQHSEYTSLNHSQAFQCSIYLPPRDGRL